MISSTNTLLTIAMTDKQFVRFLKENNAYRPYIREMTSDENTAYRKETLDNPRYLRSFTEGKSYIAQGFNTSNANPIWRELTREWYRTVYKF